MHGVTSIIINVYLSSNEIDGWCRTFFNDFMLLICLVPK